MGISKRATRIILVRVVFVFPLALSSTKPEARYLTANPAVTVVTCCQRPEISASPTGHSSLNSRRQLLITCILTDDAGSGNLSRCNQQQSSPLNVERLAPQAMAQPVGACPACIAEC